jgi:hypothetical protein
MPTESAGHSTFLGSPAIEELSSFLVDQRIAGESENALADLVALDL